MKTIRVVSEGNRSSQPNNRFKGNREIVAAGYHSSSSSGSYSSDRKVSCIRTIAVVENPISRCLSLPKNSQPTSSTSSTSPAEMLILNNERVKITDAKESSIDLKTELRSTTSCDRQNIESVTQIHHGHNHTFHMDMDTIQTDTIQPSREEGTIEVNTSNIDLEDKLPLQQQSSIRIRRRKIHVKSLNLNILKR